MAMSGLTLRPGDVGPSSAHVMQGTSSVGDGTVPAFVTDSSLPLDTDTDPEVTKGGHPESNTRNSYNFIEVVSKAQR